MYVSGKVWADVSERTFVVDAATVVEPVAVPTVPEAVKTCVGQCPLLSEENGEKSQVNH